ncbi:MULTISPECIES: hypothetical protein [Rossellomorea]|jgi:hypothetical protein|uniref:Uncharacterized protein n=1 Tax=Rossellomorea vietnamensis TaxID=218284 RepID=A0A6I6USI2_9BACI|nr:MULTISPECIES: hypothetical protein [Rossellomorea]OXS62192.1 hypothetical protein B1B00_08035 [Bacillus sp. DSM 27956]PRX77505.1 hypothetical protein B0G93_105206 [Bacillus sp. V-88]MCA0147946.1 hypothetical protein [Rossellomorea vietnamensis]QHE61882.1 hypothetical protein FHE72_13310 [Rossellomorea vietnamensis]UTE76025.1 hypothetical protein M1J35_15705 [Rossellomorea sp. KS-H15a]
MSVVFNDLLISYRQIWKNRMLANNDVSPEQVLKEAIKRELEDANSHPRVRKSIEVKYYLATKRITESDLSNDDKVRLIHLHIEMAAQLMKDRNL